MSKREPFSTKLDSELKQKLIKLSEKTDIPQTKLLERALKLLFEQHGL